MIISEAFFVDVSIIEQNLHATELIFPNTPVPANKMRLFGTMYYALCFTYT